MTELFNELPRDTGGRALRVRRGGLLLQGRIRVVATRAIAAPQLVLARGWFEGMQVNTIEPAATDEAPAEGRRVALTYGRLEPGDAMTVWTDAGRSERPRDAPLDVELRDITVLP